MSCFTITAALIASIIPLITGLPLAAETATLSKRYCATLDAGQCAVQISKPADGSTSSLSVTAFDSTCTHIIGSVANPTLGQSYSFEDNRQLILSSLDFPDGFPSADQQANGATTNFTWNGAHYDQAACVCDVESAYFYDANTCSCTVTC